MPIALERRLKHEARMKWPKNKEHQDKYVYGTLRKLGWKPRRERGKRRRK